LLHFGGHPLCAGSLGNLKPLTKRIFLNRFPYAIVYKVYSNELIMVFATMHMKRKPDYWEKRLK